MKTLAMLLLLAAPMLAHATDVHPGDSLDDVQSALGAPRGQIQLGNKLLLDYDRGQVQLVDGKVTSSNLPSPEELATQQAQHVAEGQALKAQKLVDPTFTSEPANLQLTFWKNFRLRYPEVSCDDEYKAAQEAAQAAQDAQNARAAQDAQIAQNARNAQAAQDAQDAAQAAQDARNAQAAQDAQAAAQAAQDARNAQAAQDAQAAQNAQQQQYAQQQQDAQAALCAQQQQAAQAAPATPATPAAPAPTPVLLPPPPAGFGRPQR